MMRILQATGTAVMALLAASCGGVPVTERPPDAGLVAGIIRVKDAETGMAVKGALVSVQEARSEYLISKPTDEVGEVMFIRKYQGRTAKHMLPPYFRIEVIKAGYVGALVTTSATSFLSRYGDEDIYRTRTLLLEKGKGLRKKDGFEEDGE